MIAPKPATAARYQVTLEVTAVRYRAEDFAVLAGVTDDGEEITVVGPLAHVHEGESIAVEGSLRRHPRHGEQLQAERVRVLPPTGEAALLGYLGAVKHVGPRGAQWLLERHGAEVLAVIDRDPGGRLREVPGIGPARLRAAVRSWESLGAQRAVRMFLEEHGVPAAAAARLVRALGPGAIETLRTDPYAATEVEGIGFATADALAQALGVPPDAPERLDAGILHALHQAESDGHCHLPRAELAERARRLLGAEAAERLDVLAASGRLAEEDGCLADPAMDGLERRLARTVRELATSEPALRLDPPPRPTTGAFVPSQDQWAIVRSVIEHRLSILTGGPGTGKTSSMRALVDFLRERRRRVVLCAPTGKAARRLAESTGASASTIHRLLEWVPGEGFARGPEDPIDGCDVLIVDEASMLSVRLADALLGAVGPRTHVLLVGDVDQLAPVGPGRVLEDLLASGLVPAVRLTEVFRQAARSLIVRAAHAINRGEAPPLDAGADGVRDFFLIERHGADAIFSEVVALASERLPAHYGLDARADVLVLAPMHRGPVGIDALNAELRGRLNADGQAIAGTPFRVGDRVIETRNNHERELMNGELGVLAAHDRDADTVVLACDDGRRLTLEVSELETMRLAHAISIHKSQGSEAPAVVVPLHTGHHVMLTRNLLYTAVTRSERVCVVVGEPQALHAALRRPDAGRRYTRLAERVRRNE